MQRRLHPRVRLRLLARLRWSAPLEQRTDQCETINVSRGGLLLTSSEAHGVGHPIWVTIPFDPEASGPQPETLARIVRCDALDRARRERTSGQWTVAMQFEGLPPPQARDYVNRKVGHNGASNKIFLPIRVRPENVPWHEEAMTVEVSPEKLKFVTNREYFFGQRLRIAFASGEAPWSGDSEWLAQVTGIEMEAGKESVSVTVRKKSP